MSIWKFCESFDQLYPFGTPGEYWPSKEGDIPVKEMSEAHIINCMKIVGEDDEWFWYFARELERRGCE